MLATDERLVTTRRYESEQIAETAIVSARFAHELLDIIAAQVKPGVRESEIKAFAQACFDQHGVERIWHQHYIRFSDHTLLTYRDKTPDDYQMQDTDIAFIDIGIVKDGIEGDAGKTVTTGQHPQHKRLQKASMAIFMEAKAYWQQRQSNGIDLYNHIHKLAKDMDVTFNLDPAGHLIGAFPHRGWKTGLNTYPQKVMSGTWILEIQICDHARQYGAFYEDLLY